MIGLVLAGGKGTRLWPCTMLINKHLLPVFDKPMIYYPITNLVLMGCNEIVIVINARDFELFLSLQRYLEVLNIKVALVIQHEGSAGIPSAINSSKEIINEPFYCILGDNLLFGAKSLSQARQAVEGNPNNVTIFTKVVKDPREFGVVNRSSDGSIESLVEKPEKPNSSEVLTGLMYCTADIFDKISDLTPSSRGETELVDLLTKYLKMERLRALPLNRATVWLDAGRPVSLQRASDYVSLMQAEQGERFGVIEEAAISSNLITKEELVSRLSSIAPSDEYLDYIKKV